MSPDDPRHGTHRGYRAHRRAGEDACERCRAANTRYHKVRRLDAQRGLERSVPRGPSVRMLQALMADGWAATELSTRLGHSTRWVIEFLNCRTTDVMRRSTEAKIERLYTRLEAYPGPSNITRLRAARKGWHRSDDYEDIITGELRPKVSATKAPRDRRDETLIDLVWAAGVPFDLEPLSPLEKAEICRRWHRSGRSLAELARLTGWRPDRYYRVNHTHQEAA